MVKPCKKDNTNCFRNCSGKCGNSIENDNYQVQWDRQEASGSHFSGIIPEVDSSHDLSWINGRVFKYCINLLNSINLIYSKLINLIK